MWADLESTCCYGDRIGVVVNRQESNGKSIMSTADMPGSETNLYTV